MGTKFFMSTAAALLFSFSAQAQAVGYIDEIKTLGYIAGQGMACGASKFQTFEMLARAILITKAPNNKMQAKAMYAYNNAKADGYFAKQADGFFECDNINQRFDNQPIYEATLYADGTIKMPDGKIFTPRKPYDATLLYKDRNDRTKAQKIYDKGKKIKADKVNVENTSADQAVVASDQNYEIKESSGYSSSGYYQQPQEQSVGHIKRQ